MDAARAHVLLVGGDPRDVRLARQAFTDAQVWHTLHVVEDGEEALEFLHRRGQYSSAPRPDLTLLDLGRPDRDGRAVLSEMRGDPDLSAIPVLDLSRARVGDVDAGGDAGDGGDAAGPSAERDRGGDAAERLRRFWREHGRPPRVSSAVAPRNPRVLFVEGNGDDARRAAHLLARTPAGFRVIGAATLEDAHKRLAHDGIDLVLIDLDRREPPGAEAVDDLLLSHPALPIIALAGEDDPRRATLLIQRGVQDVLLKDRVDPALLERSALYAIDRARRDVELRVGRRFLEIANRHHDAVALLRETIPALQALSRCRAVGIRLIGEDGVARFVAAAGYSDAFLRREAGLDLARDHCLCTEVMAESLSRDLPYVTDSGSLRTGCTSGLLATMAEEDRRALRNVCNRYGYESLTLVPIRAEGQMLGLIHVADPEQRRVDDRAVELLEQAAMQIGTALDRIRSHAELREREAQLTRADRLATVGKLTAGVTHEINNPLTYILYNLQTATDDLPKLIDALSQLRASIASSRGDRAATPETAVALEQPDEAWTADLQERLGDAFEGACRVRDIVADLKLFARIGDETLGSVDLAVPAARAATLAFNEIKYRAALVKDLRPTPSILADEGRLGQVFLNLLINAAHAIAEGDVRSNEIRLRTWSEEDAVFAAVEDTGEGIRPEHLPRVFEPFFTTRDRAVSSGLGLTIARATVERYGGELWVESTPGTGTSVTMRFPLEPRTSDEESSEDPAAAREEAARARVLVADDDPLVRRLMERTLEGEHDVVTVASGREARDLLLGNGSFDVILCDLMMADMSGMDLHRWLVEHRPDMADRTCFVTGGVFTERAQRFLADAPNPTLDKPFRPADVRSMVRRLLKT